MRDELFSQRIQEICPPNKLSPDDSTIIKIIKRELRSEDRDINEYPDPSDMVFDLGGTFTDIESISIDPQGLEFPNTLDGITAKNNSAKWSFLSNPGQVYECFVPRGNYVLDTILSVLVEQMNAVMQPNSRVFTFQFVRESRSIEFTSYLNTPAPQDPFFVQSSIATVVMSLPNHGFQVGDSFLLTTPTSPDGLGGLSPSDLSGVFTVTVVQDINTIQFELTNDVPFNSGQFGGPAGSVLVGKLDPFKFIHSPTSVLPQVGYVAEDSATVCLESTSPYVIMITTNGFLAHSSQPHYTMLGDRLFTTNKAQTVTVLEVIDPFTLRLDAVVPLDTTVLMNPSLVLLYEPNLCENKGIFDTNNGSRLSGPRTDMIPPNNIFYIDNDHVLVRPRLRPRGEGMQNSTYRVSSPSYFGFSSTQSSLINGVPLQYINLQGLTSVAITLPDIETNYYAKNVERIWTKIQLSDQATSDLFNTQSSAQGTFEWPSQLDKLRIQIVTMQNDLVDFQGMNYSFTVYIKIRTVQRPKHTHQLYYP
jgi:hypothetical protein